MFNNSNNENNNNNLNTDNSNYESKNNINSESDSLNMDNNEKETTNNNEQNNNGNNFIKNKENNINKDNSKSYNNNKDNNLNNNNRISGNRHYNNINYNNKDNNLNNNNRISGNRHYNNINYNNKNVNNREKLFNQTSYYNKNEVNKFHNYQDNKTVSINNYRKTISANKEPCIKVSFLGGVGEIGKNMTVIEYNDEIIVIDCGLSFPSIDMPGVDLVIPDSQYLVSRKNKIKGLVLTHGHEDHIGAIPYVFKEVKMPIYGTKLTLSLLENKLREHNIENVQMNIVQPKSVISLGNNFKVEFIKVSHSIAGACALAIYTPLGIIFHTGDFKVDYTPVDNQVTDLQRIAEIGLKGVLLLLCESTNVEKPGHSMSETTVGRSLNNIFADNLTRRLIIATFASNVHRMQQIIDLASKYNRRVAFSGRSMLNVAEVAARIGELKYDKNIIVDIEKINKIEDKNLVIITTGSQGEPMSALTRMASDDFLKVRIGSNDTVIISASPIPGNERLIYNVINNLYRKDAKVIYESLHEIHVSGHACVEELKLIMTLIKPRYFIPVHGELRHLKKNRELAMTLGIPIENTIIPEIGMQVDVGRRILSISNQIPVGSLLVDGLGVGDVGSIVLRDRKHLAEDGLLVVFIGLNSLSKEIIDLEITTRGFLYTVSEELFDEAKELLADLLSSLDLKENADLAAIKNIVRKELKNFLYKKTKRNPMILTTILMT